MEAEKDERIQRKEIEHEVMLRSLDTLQKSFHYLRKVNVASSFVGKDEKAINVQYAQIKEATEYWENNYCLLPRSIREQFVQVSNLASVCLNPTLQRSHQWP